MVMMAPVSVWVFDEAPAILQALSPHGGDEDFIAEMPPGSTGKFGALFEEGTRFGCCDVSEHAHPTRPGWTVLIGAHA